MTAPLPLPDDPSDEARESAVRLMRVHDEMGSAAFLGALYDLVFMGLIEQRGSGVTINLDEPQ